MAHAPLLGERLTAVLEGKEGKAAARALEILLALARVFDARAFAPVSSAQVSGVSFRSLSEAGLEFLESLAADARVAVPALLNPAGMDLRAWRAMGVDEAFAGMQQRVIDAYVRMGVEPACTCTPYLAGHVPREGELLAWGESSAVTYVNSVLGARSNREGGPAALAAALIGQTPVYGLHLDENRRPAVSVRLDDEAGTPARLGALGIVLGKRAAGRIPLIDSREKPSAEGLKALAAALPTYSGVSLFHWKHVTPEWARDAAPADEIVVTSGDIDEAIRGCRDEAQAPDLVFLGCPHLSLVELEAVAGGLAGRRVRTPLWLLVSRRVAGEAERLGLLAPIAEAGGEVFCDTCPVVAPPMERFARIMTDSAKGCWYMRGVHGSRVRLGTLEACLDEATRGP
jgi:predicted aconitase